MGQLKAIITDFDGTLVDTMMANYYAYSEAFEMNGLSLSEEEYKERYGMRFDDLCKSLNINDDEVKRNIKELKSKLYPKYFNKIRVNNELLSFIILCKNQGMKTCIASTASKNNLYGVLNHFKLRDYFDVIITGEDVKYGKPNPEVYYKSINALNCSSEDAIVFEDSNIGCEAAENAGISYIKITKYS